jgi:O-antigen ligase
MWRDIVISQRRKSAADPIGVAAWVAGATLVLQPITRVNGFIYPHYINGVILTIATLALLTLWLVRVAGGGGGRRIGPAEICLLFFSLCGLAQVFLARNFRISIISEVNLLIPIVWALLLARLLPGRRAIRFVARAVVASGALASLVAFFYLIWKGNTGAVEWVVGHRNFLAIFILPSAILCLAELSAGLFRAKEGILGLPKYVTAPIAIAIIVVIGISGSIGGLLGIVVGVGLLALLPLSNRLRAAALVLALVVGIAGIVVLSQPKVEAKTAQNQQFQRWYLWKGAVKMFAEHPWAGWGPGMFQLYFADFKPTAPKRYGILTSITYHPHNEFLLIAVEHGLAGLALYVGAFVLLVTVVVRKVQRTEDASERLKLWALGCAFGAMLAHGMVTVALRYWAPSAVFWTIVGALIASIEKPLAPRPLLARGRLELQAIAALVGLGVAIATFSAYLKPGMQAEWLLNGAFGEIRQPAARAECCVRARELSRNPSDYLKSYQLQAGFELESDNLDGAIATMKELEEVAPGYAHVRAVLAEFYMRRLKKEGKFQNASGDPDLSRAIEMFERAVRQDPWDAKARLELARCLMMESPSNVLKSIEHAEVAAVVEPESAGAHLMLSTLLLDAGRASEALTHAELAEKYTKPDAAEALERIRWVKEQCLKSIRREAAGSTRGPGE